MILKQASLPKDIVTLGVEGISRIWRKAKLKAVGLMREKTLYGATEHSIGSREGVTTARLEIRMLLEDYESRSARLHEIMTQIESLIKQIPMTEKLMEINGVGIKTVSGFLAEVGDISQFDNP